jgi:hypothetical protein
VFFPEGAFRSDGLIAKNPLPEQNGITAQPMALAELQPNIAS